MGPRWADFVEEDWKFEQKIIQAGREGRLYVEASPASH
jgi:hypothetical protein